MTATPKRVAVIGAGSAGVCAAKHLLEAGHRVTVYELGSYVGGLWKHDNDNGRSQAYDRLAIITPRDRTAFEGFPFDDETPRFPTHRDMYRYLDAYARHFGVMEHIRFNTAVELIEPAPAPDGEPAWTVHLADGTAERFDAVIVATGHLNEPAHVERFRTEFTGEYLHANTYRNPLPFVGKRMCVVGTGNTGVDIAHDLCNVAARTLLVARSPVRIQPKVVLGIAYPDVALGLRKPWIPAWFRNRVLSALVYLAHGDQRRLGFETPTARQHPTSSEYIVSDIEFGRVVVKPGIERIDGRTLTFADGSREEVDVIVAATGYRVHLPFVPPEVVKVEGNKVDLYKRIFPVDRPGLYFLGMLNPLAAYAQVFEAQMKVLTQHLGGNFALPSRDEMLASIEADQNLARAAYTDSPRHELEEADPNYPATLRSLQVEGYLRKRFRGRVPWPLRTGVGRWVTGRMVRRRLQPTVR